MASDATNRPGLSEPRAELTGGDPALWDSVHAGQRESLEGSVYPLRSAPERAILRTVLERARPQLGETVLELGCGSSRYLPYVALETGASIIGVDFSPLGVRQTRRALASVGADPTGIFEGRIEDFVENHPDEFDVVVSHGLVEHFDDLRRAVRWHLSTTRVGGRVVITAPNLDRANLAWARRVAPNLFRWHRPVSAPQIASLVRDGGGTEIISEYLGGPRLFAYPEPGSSSPTRHRTALVARKIANGSSELIHRCAPKLAERAGGAAFSPFFAVSATRGS